VTTAAQWTGRYRNSLVSLMALVVLLAIWWLPRVTTGDNAPEPRNPPTSSTADPASGLPIVDVGSLPAEASATLALIDAGGPFPYDEDGGVFRNEERVLPDQDRGFYREYTVETPGSDDRGARRIVSGHDGTFYWTGDHYRTFSRIRRVSTP
jgi:ribonuclease T1